MLAENLKQLAQNNGQNVTFLDESYGSMVEVVKLCDSSGGNVELVII